MTYLNFYYFIIIDGRIYNNNYKTKILTKNDKKQDKITTRKSLKYEKKHFFYLPEKISGSL